MDADAGANIFGEGEVTTVRVTLDSARVRDLLQPRNAFSREYRTCSVRVTNFATGNNDWFYSNPETGRFEYVPFDLDNTLGVDFFSMNWATRF